MWITLIRKTLEIWHELSFKSSRSHIACVPLLLIVIVSKRRKEEGTSVFIHRL